MTGKAALRARMASAWLQPNHRLLQDSQPLANPPHNALKLYKNED